VESDLLFPACIEPCLRSQPLSPPEVAFSSVNTHAKSHSLTRGSNPGEQRDWSKAGKTYRMDPPVPSRQAQYNLSSGVLFVQQMLPLHCPTTGEEAFEFRTRGSLDPQAATHGNLTRVVFLLQLIRIIRRVPPQYCMAVWIRLQQV
jgi:hypothetical protein